MSPADVLGSQAQLDSFLRTALLSSGGVDVDLDALVARGYGAYPSDVRRLIEATPDRLDRAHSSEYALDGRQLDAAQSRLPIPHPLDFEWRFSAEGAAHLRERLTHSAPAGGEVALLGTPGFAELLVADRLTSLPVLFERRPEACEALRGLPGLAVEEGDVGQTSRGHAQRFAVSVADPPWYPEVCRTFMRSAATLLQDAGVLMWCAPGIGTRPGIPAERAELIEMAMAHGFVLEELSVGVVEYESPPFELAALRAAGLPRFHSRWRRGDLLTFRKVGNSSAENSRTATAPVDDWEEVTIGRARVRVRTSDPHDGTNFDLQEIVPGNVLESVSSRDARRAQANVWTTTNRIWFTNDPSRLVSELRAYAIDIHPKVDNPASDAAATIVRTEVDLLRSLGVE